MSRVRGVLVSLSVVALVTACGGADEDRAAPASSTTSSAAPSPSAEAGPNAWPPQDPVALVQARYGSCLKALGAAEGVEDRGDGSPPWRVTFRGEGGQRLAFNLAPFKTGKTGTVPADDRTTDLIESADC